MNAPRTQSPVAGPRPLALVALLALLSARCGVFSERTALHVAFGPADIKSLGLARFAEMKSFVVAYELEPACALQISRAPGVPRDREWTSLDAAALVKGVYTIEERVAQDNGPHVDFIALKVRDNRGTVAWIRNTPAGPSPDAARRLSCLVDASSVRDALPKSAAKLVRLTPRAPGCAEVTPILGTTEDITFGAYAATSVGVFAGRAPSAGELDTGTLRPVAVGVTLTSEGGQKRITLKASYFDRCFVADDSPAPRDEIDRARAWLGAPGELDEAPTPAFGLDAMRAAMGLDPKACAGAASAPKDCHASIVVPRAGAELGPFGARRIVFGSDRRAAALRVEGGKLTPRRDGDLVQVAIRPGKSTSAEAARATLDAARASLDDRRKASLRRSHGYRLSPEPDAAFVVEIDAEVKLGGPLSTPLSAPPTTLARASKKAPNPAAARAAIELRDAREALARSERDAALVKLTLGAGKATCEKLPAALARHCQSLIADDPAAVAAARLGAAASRVQAAEALVRSTPPEIAIADASAPKAASPRQAGLASLEVVIRATGEHGKEGKEVFSQKLSSIPLSLGDGGAAEPKPADIQAALGKLALGAIDGAIAEWRLESVLRGDVEPMRRGSRAWATANAVHAAGDRPVKLLADVTEARAEVLAPPNVLYRVALPKDASRRCFTLTASPLDGAVDVNMTLGLVAKGAGFVPLHRDDRASPDAAFEVCHLPEGDYAISIEQRGDERAKAITMALFDSTPGGVGAEEARAATRGSPPAARPSEIVVLGPRPAAP